MKTITRAEWKKLHRDYKGQLNGGPAMLELQENGATALVPVVIVKGS